MQKDPPWESYEYAKESMHIKVENLYMVDAYDLNIVESAKLTKGC